MLGNRRLVITAVLASLGFVSLTFVARIARGQWAMGALPFARRIFVTPIPGAPFSATEEISITSAATNGSPFQRRSFALIARDSGGRIHNESRVNVPLTSTRDPWLVSFMVYDPNRQMSTFMNPYTHIAREITFTRAAGTAPPNNWAQHQSPSTLGDPNVRLEDLGTSLLEGLEVHGYRRTVTLPQKISGTEQPVIVVDEYWYSEDLHINLLEKHTDPRTGELTVRLTKLIRVEPPSNLFDVPLDYKVVDITPPSPSLESQ
ncbi:MAG TPA: hypothetical protein VKT50_13145 [Candidatus Acidoferrales bacterium]|nr:hypothetical protein [Candidatus Acidoferrales bacterium]